MCSENSYVEAQIPAFDSFTGRLWKVITVDEVIIEDDFCFKRRRHELILSSPYEDTDRSWPTASQGNSHRNTSYHMLNLAFLSFRIMRKKCLLLKPPRSQHFIIAVPACYDSAHIRDPAKVTLESYSFSPGNNVTGLAPHAHWPNYPF